MDFESRYRAVTARDARFDGWFFTAVTSTGIYCRPSCPARTPAPVNVRFYPTAAAAQRAGFRACLRCRPDASPGSPEWNLRADVVGRAMRLIADGVVDRQGVGGLAERLGYGTRHLHRLLSSELGAGPLALARAQRVQAARILIETTDLAMADVAFAAGFASVRQFNDTIREVLGRTPTELRRRHRGVTTGIGVLVLRLPYRQPMAAAELLGFLGTRAVPGVETWDGTTYARTLRLPHGNGWVALAGADGYISARLHLDDLRDLSSAVGRCRRLLDLDADPQAVDAVLGRDLPILPGRRLPGAVDGFEMAVRAVIGQQVSVAGARTVTGRLVAAVGTPLAGAPDGLSHLFPTAAQVVEGPDDAFAMPGSRRRTLRDLARLVDTGKLAIDPGSDPEEVAAGLAAVKGIGPWTIAYITMRALGDPDVYLPTDLGVRRALQGIDATPDDWAPWRSYAVMHLWAQTKEVAA